jgi:hypothetical protein
MKQPAKSLPSLLDIEREVVAESREWGRQRLEERLQKLATEHGEVFSPQATAKPTPDAPQRIRPHSAHR